MRHDADQVIAVRVDNRVDQDVAPLSADFTFFGGLYRMVHLVSTEDLHLSLTDFGSSAVYLQTSNVSASSAELQVTAKVVNDGPAPRRPTLETTVIDASGREVSQLHSDLELTGGSEADLIQATTIPNPHLWDGLTDPYLYQARVRVLDNGRTTDEVTQPATHPVATTKGSSLTTAWYAKTRFTGTRPTGRANRWSTSPIGVSIRGRTRRSP